MAVSVDKKMVQGFMDQATGTHRPVDKTNLLLTAIAYGILTLIEQNEEAAQAAARR